RLPARRRRRRGLLRRVPRLRVRRPRGEAVGHARVRSARSHAELDLARGAQRVIKLGRISYVNMAPVFYRVGMEVEEVQGVPTELNRLLVDGELDTAPI